MADQEAQIDIRYTDLSDGRYLKQWLLDPTIGRWFPVHDEAEIDDAVHRWVGFSRYKCSLTAVKNGEPCGLATLYLQPYRKLAHQCEFGIIVGKGYRGQGIGTSLLKNLIHLASDKFKIELLHLQVYSENPAIRLYERFGFKEFGRQNHWIKESDGSYTGRVFMEKYLKPETFDK
jgi:RimJ/RimL family protein N-acetyltransferase